MMDRIESRRLMQETSDKEIREMIDRLKKKRKINL